MNLADHRIQTQIHACSCQVTGQKVLLPTTQFVVWNGYAFIISSMMLHVDWMHTNELCQYHTSAIIPRNTITWFQSLHSNFLFYFGDLDHDVTITYKLVDSLRWTLCLQVTQNKCVTKLMMLAYTGIHRKTKEMTPVVSQSMQDYSLQADENFHLCSSA